MPFQSPTIDPNTTTPAADISKIKNDLGVLRSVIGGGNDGDVPNASQPLAPRVSAATTGASVTPTTVLDLVRVNALNSALTVNNPTGTPADGFSFVLCVKDDGTARALTWGSNYTGIGEALRGTTVANKWMYWPVTWNAAAARWHVLPASVEP